VVRCDEAPHLAEGLEILKDTVLKDSVEFVFERSEHSGHLETVNALVFKFSFPVQLSQVPQSELVQYVAHARSHFRLVQVRVHLHGVLARHFLGLGVEPRRAALKSTG